MNESPIPTLQTERLVLRPLTASDRDGIFAYASDPEVTRYVAWERHASPGDTLRYLEEFVAAGYRRGDFYDWGICPEGPGFLVGTCGLPRVEPVHGFAEMGYVLSRECWGRGYATEAAREMIRFGFHVLGLKRIEAHCRTENRASERVMQKVGMEYEGLLRSRLFHDGAHHDVKLYAAINRFIP